MEKLFSQWLERAEHKRFFMTDRRVSTPPPQASSRQDGPVIVDIPPEGLLLDTPGVYTFGDDIVWAGTAGAAVTIAADGVVLDLAGHALLCANQTLETTGIRVSRSKDATVRDGTVGGTGKDGLAVEESENCTVRGMTVRDVATDEIVRYTTPTGFRAVGCLGVTFSECTVRDVRVRVGNFTGFDIVRCVDTTVRGCRVQDCVNLDGALVGYSPFLSARTVVRRCRAERLQTFFGGNTNTQGHTCIGFSPFFSEDLRFLCCHARDIVGTCDDAHGFSMFVCVGPILLQKCTVENVRDGVGTGTGAKATGIEIYSSDTDVVDCVVRNVSAVGPQDRQCTGFSVSGSIVTGEATRVRFFRCRATDVRVVDEDDVPDASAGYGTGFGWAPDPRPEFRVGCSGITYEDCTAERCQVGFDSWWHKDSLWKNIGARGCGIAVLDLKDSRRTLACDACSECDPPLVVTLENQARDNTFHCVRAVYPKN